MILYHGSYLKIQTPKILRSNRALDFGDAFYTTSDLEQASKWAKISANRNGINQAVVSVFDFDDSKLQNLKFLYFENPNSNWLKLVSSYRSKKLIADELDLIIGPVANDRTFDVIQLYLAEIYNEDETIKRLLPFKLKDQYAFKTEAALKFLKFSKELLL